MDRFLRGLDSGSDREEELEEEDTEESELLDKSEEDSLESESLDEEEESELEEELEELLFLFVLSFFFVAASVILKHNHSW